MTDSRFIFDKNKCVACEACVVACIIENGRQQPGNWRNVLSSNPMKLPGIPLFNISMSCNHCQDAPCMENCPALAYSRSPLSGAVLHSADACIGCRYCTWTCPYDAPSFDPLQGVVGKCDFCESRIRQQLVPACVNACPTGALDFSFGDTGPDSGSTEGLPAPPPSIHVPVITHPSVIIRELEKESGPRMEMSLFEANGKSGEGDVSVRGDLPGPSTKHKHKISAASEWSLLLFSLIIPAMLALSLTDVVRDGGPAAKAAFMAAGILGAGLSTLHLGRPLRAWRALLNVRKSWLSREIASFLLFLSAVCMDLFVVPLPKLLILITGIALLVSMDMLYGPAQIYKKNRADPFLASLVAISLYLLLSQMYTVFILFMLARLAMVLLFKEERRSRRDIIFSRIRIAGMVLTLACILFHAAPPLTLLALVVVEVLGRALFFNSLDVPVPVLKNQAH
ncbi:MAG: DmsC/YnfH family molybdoenzyme membrane anchor subunit [Bacteroidota bacterium]